jgi:hypothetical protein
VIVLPFAVDALASGHEAVEATKNTGRACTKAALNENGCAFFKLFANFYCFSFVVS